MTAGSTALAPIPISIRVTGHTSYAIYVAVNIMFSQAICKQGSGKRFLQFTNVHLSQKMLIAH
jgi:hypothetical protein